jgi:hypothetical protein
MIRDNSSFSSLTFITLINNFESSCLPILMAILDSKNLNGFAYFQAIVSQVVFALKVIGSEISTLFKNDTSIKSCFLKG